MTTEKLRPWTRLPLPQPKLFDPGVEYFYENFVRPLSDDMIKLMCTGIHIDKYAVEELRSTIDDVLSNVDALLLRNPIIKKYQEKRAIVAQKVHVKKCMSSVRTPEYFYREYNNSVIHRTWVVNTYLKSIGENKDIKDSWTVRELKNYNTYKVNEIIRSIVDKSISKKSTVLKAGMQALAEYKAELWNRPRRNKSNETADLDSFNSGSAKQKQELFDMLGIEPMAFSDTSGNGSWGREYIELLLRQSDHKDKDFDEVLQCIIDYSFSGIIRNNFLKAFDTYTINGVLHGNIKLFGAKSLKSWS